MRIRQITGPSYRLVTLFDIPVKVHWTFGLLVLFIAYVAQANSLNWVEASVFGAYILCLFLFVIMHEYGHALAAKAYQIKTRDIIISPIGGVARLESIPVNPKHELVVALAGPLVNVGLYLVLTIVQLMLGGRLIPNIEELSLDATPTDFIRLMMLVNGTLVLFNMIPAFPMDGGRVLRAALSMLTDSRVKATQIASVLGQIIAGGFILYGIYTSHYALMMIGVFVIITARQEYQQVKMYDRISRITVRDIMVKDLPRMPYNVRWSSVRGTNVVEDILLINEQDQIVGVTPLFSMQDMQKEREHETDETYLSERSLGLSSIGLIPAEYNIQKAIQCMNNSGWLVAQVSDNEGNIGWITRDIINRRLMH